MPYVNLRLSCTRCGAGFSAHRPTQKFCSKRCASLDRAPTPAPCTVASCDRVAHAQGWCDLHYRRWKRTGSADGRATLAQRVHKFTRRTDGCWEWIGWLDSKGYGRIKLGRTTSTGAHRASYEMLVGPIPPGPAGTSWSELVALLRQPWRKAAACRGKPIDLFVPKSIRSPTDEARAICAGCPVTAECRAEAERTGDEGIWGGVDERERRAERRQASSALAVPGRQPAGVGLQLDRV